jgi:hypothetical protein
VDFLKNNWMGVASSSVIDPFSRIYNIWSTLLILSFGYNLFFVPIAICFDYKIENELYSVDVIVVVIAILDIMVKFNSAFIYESAIPVDYLAIHTTYNAIAWYRILRLLKFFRVYEILGQVSKFAKISMKLYPLIVYFAMFIYLTHFAA